MIIFATTITPRLKYISNFISQEILTEELLLTSDTETFTNYQGPRINYSQSPVSGSEILIIPHSLLFETTITDQQIDCFETNGYKAFFKTGGDVAFDLFAASFYLISRYEEYLPHEKDEYGRYAHLNSLAFSKNFLKVPLVNIWMKHLKEIIRLKFPSVRSRDNKFSFIPTYDIDMAWSYRHKGWMRNLTGLIKHLLKGEWVTFKDRISILRGKQQDPFDSYGWLNSQHEKYRLKPYYFFLLAARPGRYDKNISPVQSAMKALISDHLIRYPVGIHPSWQSGDDTGMLAGEIKALSEVTGNQVLSSRQHYIRLTLPATYRLLIAAGIRFDFSMGYGSINGFRASVASPFYWYDLEKEVQTELMLFPFCYMEANSFYEERYTSIEALEEMRHYYQQVKAVEGLYMMIWHNSFLGTDKLYKGWRETYETFLKESMSGKA